jgi:hypothetical protein
MNRGERMDYETTDRARHFVVRNLLDMEGKISDHEYAMEQGVVPIRDLRSEMQIELSTLHSLLSGIDTGAIVPVYDDEDDEPKFMLHPDPSPALNDAWAEVNEMLEESFVLNNDEWYLYLIS